ncbi:EVE domain-containing protein [Halogeometricum rufum]|uniref:EVE domain-containing protein n=1 Tax=Halogeometricum rufum TaxID=553469 RepID=UPI000B7C6996|nr:EVE domain-containing protein [Halogeometricum rufum]
MSGDLFRITVDETNYSRVLGTSPDESLLTDAHLQELRGSRLWAQKNTEKGQEVYDAMEPGDGLLFYKVKRGIAPDEGMYVGTGRVGEKVRLDEEQARILFRTTVATLAYTVTEFNQIRKSIEEVESALGYVSYPQSSHRVTNNRYTTVDRALKMLSH